MSKRILYIMQSAPYLNDRVTEAFDAILVTAAFEQSVSLLFRGDGVQQLLAKQSVTGQRNLAKMLKSLEMYEVNQIYIDRNDMEQLGLHNEDFAIPVTPVSSQASAELLALNDIVLSA